MAGRHYPAFTNPDEYLKHRVKRTPFGFLKTRTEERALDRCLRGLAEVRVICDVPSGPGRLFRFWRRKGFRVHAIDISEPMLRAAREEHRTLGLTGSVRGGDAFNLKGGLTETPDLVASIRFAYYFDRAQRIKLLRLLADVSRHYVLVQYKTSETIRGRRNVIRASREQAASKTGPKKHFVTREEIVQEVIEADLAPLRVQGMGEFSDRIFVLAERPQADPRHGGAAAAIETRSFRPFWACLKAVVLMPIAIMWVWLSLKAKRD